ncbi:MAG TPA: 5-(carboxyamino)imidazole ribonucleotide mutase [Thermoplasmata archaeon]|nr:5-(carboxyamino)imidazole ribonucleotide mutase [Thermoplasmata archaeon]
MGAAMFAKLFVSPSLGRPVKVTVLVGSKSDLEIAEKVRSRLTELGVGCEVHVASAHRDPDKVDRLVRDPATDVFVAMAGLSAALPGVVAARTLKPVVGVPLHRGLGLDSLLSVVQMPPGIPVAAVGLDAAENAALLAAEILALKFPELTKALEAYRAKWREEPAPSPPTGAPP